MSNDNLCGKSILTPHSTPWQSKILNLLGWIILLFGLTGAAAVFYYMQIITFSPSIVIDPFGMIAFLLCLALAALGFPLLITLSYLVKEIASIRQSIEQQAVSPDRSAT
jgi:hypothetical protein